MKKWMRGCLMTLLALSVALTLGWQALPGSAEAASVRIDALTINDMEANGGEYLELNEGTISIGWSASGAVEHYVLTVLDNQGRSIMGPITLPVDTTSAYISAEDASLLTQAQVYFVEVSAVPADPSQETATASAGFYLSTSEPGAVVGKEYTVKYSYEEEIPGAPNLPSDLSYAAGMIVILVSVPAPDGFEFGGWSVYKETASGQREEVTVTDDNSFTMPEANVNVVGSWVPKEYTVTYTYGELVPEGAPALPEAKAYPYNSEVKLAPVPEVDGYTFVGWKIDGANAGDSFTMPNHDVTVIGSWSIDQHYASFAFLGDIPEGVHPPTSGTYAFGDIVALPEVTEVPGYEFSGWTLNGAPFEGNTFTMPDEDISLVGTWVRITHTVTYEYDTTAIEGMPALPMTASYNVGDPVTVAADPTFTGYSFLGWVVNQTDGFFRDEIPVENGVFAMPDADVVITGSWIVTQYNVIYQYAEGSPENAPQIAPEMHDYNTPVQITAKPEMEGYVFNGWQINGADVGEFTMPDHDVIVTGSWTANEHKVTFTFDESAPDGAEVPPEVSVRYGQVIPLPEVNWKGYTFAGWTTKDAAQDADGNYVMPDQDVTFVGSWTVNEYTVSYEYVGSVPGHAPELPEARTYKCGETVEIEPVHYKLSKAELNGWTLTASLPNFAQDEETGVIRFTMPDRDVVVQGNWVPLESGGGAIPWLTALMVLLLALSTGLTIYLIATRKRYRG